MTRLAFCILSYQSEAFIANALEAVANAVVKINFTCPIYVFDDGSTDRTLEILRKMPLPPETPLILCPSPANSGEAGNVNRAFQRLAADGIDWAILLHSDDILNPGWLALIKKSLETIGEEVAMLAAARIDTPDLDGGKNGFAWPDPFQPPAVQRFLPPGEDTVRRLKWFWTVSGSAIRVKTNNAVGGWHPQLRFAGDCDFLVRFLLGGGGMLHFDYPGILKRAHGESVTLGAVRCGAYAIGYSYLMHRYLRLSSRRERLTCLAWQLWRAVRQGLAFSRRGDFIAARGQCVAASIFARSMVAMVPGLKPCNHVTVRRALGFEFAPLPPACAGSAVCARDYDIAFIGSGASTSMTLLELGRHLSQIQFEREPLRIVVIEKENEFWSGIPYGRRSSPNSLAIQKLQEFVQEPERTSYIKWLESNKPRWLKDFEQCGGAAAVAWLRNNQPLVDDGKWDEIYLPRYLYGAYLSERIHHMLNALAESGKALVTLKQAEATAISPSGDASYNITIRDATGLESSLHTERVVLAGGSPPMKPLTICAERHEQKFICINDLYFPSEEANLKRISDALHAVPEPSDRNILVVGSNASSLELLYLINQEPQIKALARSIVVISRSGSFPRKICERNPNFSFRHLEILRERSSFSAKELMDAIGADVALAEKERINIADLFYPISALIGPLFRQLDVVELEEFFCQHGMTFSKLMRRSGRDCRKAADELANQKILSIVKGDFLHLETSSADGAFATALYLQPETKASAVHPLRFAVAVNCGGFEELSSSSSPLIQNLLKTKLCAANKTNRGLLVNDRLEANDNLYVIGPLIAGNFNDKIRYWHVESAPRIQILASMLAKTLFASLLASSRQAPAPVATGHNCPQPVREAAVN